MRRVIATVAAAGLLFAVSACTVSAPSGDCTPTFTEGKASSTVTASGAFTQATTADFPTPLVSDGVQVSVLEAGDGRTVQDTDFVYFTVTGFLGSTGEMGLDAQGAQLYADADGNDVQKALLCVTEGSRLALTIPSEETGDTEVYVVDIDRTFTSKATGRAEVPQQGFPSIVTTPDGHPGFTIVGDAPTELAYSTLITGDGEKVTEGDLLILQYSYVNWSSKSVISSTWDDGSPAPVVLSAYDAASGSGLSDGVFAALEGKTVGSQVVVVLPPSALAAGSHVAVPAAATAVAVFDILGVIDIDQ